MSTHDGGFAFPQPDPAKSEIHDGYRLDRDMSLRDYFAGQALAGRQVNRNYVTWGDMAADCYEIADAMIEARKAKP